MGLLKDAAIRLLREDKWGSIEEAMQEVFAILQSSDPMVIDGPLVINNTSGQPAVTVLQENTNLPPVVFARGQDPAAYQVPLLYPPDQMGGAASGSASPVRQVTIKAVKQDSLTVDDASDDQFKGATVAKPQQLRQATAVPADVLSYGYSGEDGQQRSAEFLDDDGTTHLKEDQVVVPAYTIGDTIYIAEVLNGVTDSASSELTAQAKVAHVDLNVDARAWATKIPANNP